MGWRAVWPLAVAALWAISGPSIGAAALDVDLRARSYRPGEVVVVSVAAAGGADAVTVTLFDRDVPAHAMGSGRWRAVLGIDLDVKPGTYRLRVRAGEAEAVREIAVTPRTFAVRRLTVNPDFVNPPASVQQRIEDESRLVAEAYAAGATDPLWTTAFLRPVPQPANSRFGTRSVFNGEARNPHAGTDFLSPAGTPIKAPNAGRVAVARDLFFSGNTVILDHGAGIFSQLAHMSRIDVREGETVTPGQVVGLVGATGRVTGAHLHWGLRVNGARVDALALLAVLGGP